MGSSISAGIDGGKGGGCGSQRILATSDEESTSLGKSSRAFVLTATDLTTHSQGLWPNAELREYEFKDPTGSDEEADIVLVVNPVL